jgi:acyl-CoA synthetase (AMP-forming)/AMP-acid ligase II
MIEFSKSKKINFYTMYGQTEASPRMSFLNYLDAEKKIGSIGKAIPNTKMWLEDEKGKLIKKPGITGELIFKGDNVSLGYCNNIKDLNRKDDNVGILRTGDLAYFDKNNFFYIKGRKNRIIKIFGNRFNLDEIENKMAELKIEVICKEKNNKLLVFFDTNISKETVLGLITKVTGQNQLGFKCIKIDKFPRTTSGKIDYLKLD